MAEDEAPPLEPVEAPGPLSSSAVWTLNQAWYEGSSLGAWSSGTVPHMVTSNAVVASAYARMIVAFLRDARAAGAPPGRTYVVEVGAGSGRLGYAILRKLAPRLAAAPDLEGTDLTYVMADLGLDSLHGLRRHEQLRPLVEEGRLDFARFDMGAPGPLDLLVSGARIEAGSLSTPLVVVANYVFDALPFDAYVVEDGRASELLAAFEVPAGAADPGAKLAGGKLAWSARALGPGRRYDDDELEGLLRATTAPGPDRRVLLPTVGIGALRALRSLSSAPMLVLSADKGYGAAPADIAGDGPGMAKHGSVSFMVDYATLGRWAEARGGRAFLPSSAPLHLTVGALVLDDRAGRWPEVEQAYRDAVDVGGPDDFFSIHTYIDRNRQLPTVEQIVGWLRLCEWDPAVFRGLYRSLLLRSSARRHRGSRALSELAQRVEELYLPIGEPSDLPLSLAMLRWRAGDWDDGLRLVAWSERLHGADAERSLVEAMCHVGRGDLRAALVAVGKARLIEPDDDDVLGTYRWLQDRLDDPVEQVQAEWERLLGARERVVQEQLRDG